MATRELLLTRRGVVCVTSTGVPSADQVRAVELELAALGYVLSSRLQARLAAASLDELAALRAWAIAALAAQVGGGRKHEPLYRKFPDGVPSDTLDDWWKRVLVYFLQGADQPCLTCGRTGTTHVLAPCRHVVCDQCFDGASFSACPICQHHVDRASPFYRESPVRTTPIERVAFKRIDLGTTEVDEARALFVGLCERAQALSPADRDALLAILADYKAAVLPWLPPMIPVRENIAIVFGTLFSACGAEVMPHAQRYMATATDVLRFIAVASGTDGSLQAETIVKPFERAAKPSRFWGKIAALFGVPAPTPRPSPIYVPVQVKRFRVAKLSRSVRRALFTVLEQLDPERLVEDMLRHRSYWVWVGEFLHPHEYASRFPHVARAFQILRGKAPDGTPAPAFETWNMRLERAIDRRDSDALIAVLAARPGELARKLDLLLRLAADDAARARVLALVTAKLPAFATPVLVTLHAHLATRAAPAIRVYWPKGKVARGVSSADTRPLLPPATIAAALQLIDGELLRRFATKPAFSTTVIDDALRTIMVPFNERTASRAAIALARGSRVAIPPGKVARLFMHWCEPQVGGYSTDLDLSVALYDDAWTYVGVCSYYQLQLKDAQGVLIAQSAGDLQDGPWPDGASELVDLHRERAAAAHARYAVMVVNAYAGMSFSRLERAFAGIMLRDDLGGHHFDPRTVELKFALEGDNGVFMPVVFDLRDDLIHWLDVHAKGQFEMNNVASSKAAIAKVCPELIAYFASGARASMFDLGLLHAAARSERVIVRGTSQVFTRRPDEDRPAFYARLVRGDADDRDATLSGPALALLYRGDLELPEGSPIYALFRDQVTPTLAASDLLS